MIYTTGLDSLKKKKSVTITKVGVERVSILKEKYIYIPQMQCRAVIKDILGVTGNLILDRISDIMKFVLSSQVCYSGLLWKCP